MAEEIKKTKQTATASSSQKVTEPKSVKEQNQSSSNIVDMFDKNKMLELVDKISAVDSEILEQISLFMMLDRVIKTIDLFKQHYKKPIPENSLLESYRKLAEKQKVKVLTEIFQNYLEMTKIEASEKMLEYLFNELNVEADSEEDEETD